MGFVILDEEGETRRVRCRRRRYGWWFHGVKVESAVILPLQWRLHFHILIRAPSRVYTSSSQFTVGILRCKPIQLAKYCNLIGLPWHPCHPGLCRGVGRKLAFRVG